MLRSLVVVFAFLLIPTIGLVAPVPSTATGPVYYFPDTRGSEWIYDANGTEVKETITEVEKKKETLSVTIRREEESGRERHYRLVVSPRGLFRPSPLDESSLSCLLKIPNGHERKWTADIGAWGNGKASLTAFGPVEIKVPAGKFTAVRVEAQFDGRFGEGSYKVEYWYAVGVGLVKLHAGDYVCVLKSFTRGKR